MKNNTPLKLLVFCVGVFLTNRLYESLSAEYVRGIRVGPKVWDATRQTFLDIKDGDTFCRKSKLALDASILLRGGRPGLVAAVLSGPDGPLRSGEVMAQWIRKITMETKTARLTDDALGDVLVPSEFNLAYWVCDLSSEFVVKTALSETPSGIVPSACETKVFSFRASDC